MSPSKSILVAQFKSYSASLSFANKLGDHPNIEILELSAMGGDSFLILAGPPSDISGIDIKEIDAQVFNNNVKALLDAYLSLDNTKIKNHLMVAEDRSLVELFRVADLALEHGIGIVDFRMPRFSGAVGFLLLTTDDAESLAALQKETKSELQFLNLIQSCSSKLRSFLSIRA